MNETNETQATMQSVEEGLQNYDMSRAAECINDDFNIIKNAVENGVEQEALGEVKEFTGEFVAKLLADFEEQKVLMQKETEKAILAKNREIRELKADNKEIKGEVKEIKNILQKNEARIQENEARRPINLLKKLRSNTISAMKDLQGIVSDMTKNTGDNLLNKLDKGYLKIANLRIDYHKNQKKAHEDHLASYEIKQDKEKYIKNIDKNSKSIEKYNSKDIKKFKRSRKSYLKDEMAKDPNLNYKQANAKYEQELAKFGIRTVDDLKKIDPEFVNGLLPETSLNDRAITGTFTELERETIERSTGKIEKEDKAIRTIEEKITEHSDKMAERMLAIKERKNSHAKSVDTLIEEKAKEQAEKEKAEPNKTRSDRSKGDKEDR